MVEVANSFSCCALLKRLKNTSFTFFNQISSNFLILTQSSLKFMGKMVIIITLIWFQRTKYLQDWNQFMKSHTFHHDLRAWVTFANRLLNRPLIGLLGHFLIKRTKDLKQINTIFQSYITICKVSPPFWHLCPLFSTSNNFDTFVGYPVICYYDHPILSFISPMYTIHLVILTSPGYISHTYISH